MDTHSSLNAARPLTDIPWDFTHGPRIYRDSDGKLHSMDGRPAVVFRDGTRVWYRRGKKHRDGGPAVEYPCGSRLWYRHGRLHRADGPADESTTGCREWYWQGRRHREDGPAVERDTGYRGWYRHGLRHRDDGPACIAADGEEGWYWLDLEHRIDGPAVIRGDGTRDWWIRGLQPEPAVAALLVAGLPMRTFVTDDAHAWHPDWRRRVLDLPRGTRDLALARLLVNPDPMVAAWAASTLGHGALPLDDGQATRDRRTAAEARPHSAWVSCAAHVVTRYAMARRYR